MVFRVVTWIIAVIIGAVRALCARCARAVRKRPLGQSVIVLHFLSAGSSPRSLHPCACARGSLLSLLTHLALPLCVQSTGYRCPAMARNCELCAEICAAQRLVDDLISCAREEVHTVLDDGRSNGPQASTGAGITYRLCIAPFHTQKGAWIIFCHPYRIGLMTVCCFVPAPCCGLVLG